MRSLLSEGLHPSRSPARSLSRRSAGARRSRGSLATLARTGILGVVLATVALARAQANNPTQAVDELLAADREFARRAAAGDVIAALVPMFADDVVMAVPAVPFARGIDAAKASLEANGDNKTSKIEWAPVRGGVSSDGQHGFTFGYMTMTRGDGSATPLKYLAYWIRRPAGWRVAVYKRARASAAPASRDMLPPAAPQRIVPVSTDTAAVERFRKSLDAAERAFSDEAQKIGLGAAFAKYGSADAINMGPPSVSDFIRGSDAIGKSVSGGRTGPSELSWAPDTVLIASSGDLGVTIGTIRRNAAAPDGNQPIPFFTIWRRASTSDPWLYVAE